MDGAILLSLSNEFGGFSKMLREDAEDLMAFCLGTEAECDKPRFIFAAWFKVVDDKLISLLKSISHSLRSENSSLLVCPDQFLTEQAQLTKEVIFACATKPESDDSECQTIADAAGQVSEQIRSWCPKPKCRLVIDTTVSACYARMATMEDSWEINHARELGSFAHSPACSNQAGTF